MSVEAAASAAAKQIGYGALKDLQLEVIKGIATGRAVFALLPTRYGKSLCYGCLPYFLHHPTEHSIVCVITPRGSSAPFDPALSPTSNAQTSAIKKNTAEQLRTRGVY